MVKNYTKIINLGVKKAPNSYLRKKVKTINQFTLIWLHIIIILFVVDLLTGIYFDADLIEKMSPFISLFLLLFIFYFNSINNFIVSRKLFMATLFFTVNLSSIYAYPGIHIEYYFFIVPGLSLALYRKNIYPIIFTCLSFFCFLIPYHFFDIYPSDYATRIDYGALISFFIASFNLTNYFKKVNSENELLLEQEKKLLEKQQKELELLTKFKSHLFVNLSHELRTPLTIIKGYANKLIKNNKENATIILEQSTNIKNIIEDIMDVSKLDEQKMQLHPSEIELAFFIEKIYSDFKSLFDEKNIEFTLQNITRGIAINADEKLFYRAITNLISNALKFTHEYGKVSITILLKTNFVVLEIADNGIGIPSEDLNKVFDRFYQSENDITKSQGTGIGLALTKSILNSHNFNIKLTSIQNTKTTFSILIPKDQIFTCELNSQIKEKAIVSPTAFSVTDCTILIVDDHCQMRAYLKSLFKEHHIIEARNGKEALEKIANFNIDLIITDYMMPIMNGPSLVKNIKSQNNKTPIHVITARTDDPGKLEMLRLGIDGYLTKPFNENELLLNVNKSLIDFKAIKEYEKKNSEAHLIDDNSKENEIFNSKLNSLLKERISNPLFGVPDLIEILKIPERTLYRKIKLLTGSTPNQLIMEARFQMAKTIFDSKEYNSKKELSFAVGMTNSHYFTNKFEQRFGIKINS